MPKEKRQERSKLRRVAVGISGGAVLLLGIIAIPYPGPGWLIVFAGLGILATEFEWAGKVLEKVRSRYDAWQAWLQRQNPVIKALFWILTVFIVVITIYVLNGYGILNSLLNLNQDWLESPFVK